ncbi:hypothetical protein [Sphingopyxis sp. FD7]|jgi:predicted phage-related endonuclease|uniref:hypothetical protein n=1 Tax=Sphingopyxis sp. FD7 TaxID=1914525 RepID=UPI000DC621FB|nr:hypothetical protein [Sphingopyxis sp. FD7]BBB11862.1 CopG/DNA-binding domain-containing protein [Sphingopyxis sp. FD7]
MQTERVTFLTSPDHKKALDAFAAKRGESVGNVVREATSRYIAGRVSDDEEEALKLLAQELNEAVPKMRASLERSITKLEKTRKEVDKMLRDAGVRK